MDETYIHRQESIGCLNRAWRTVCELEKTESGSAMWSAAYRMSIIEYCKPFNCSYGTDKKKHFLLEPKILPSLLGLHRELIILRNQRLAHSDINVLNASVYKSGDITTIIKDNFTSWPPVSKIRELIEAVLDQL